MLYYTQIFCLAADLRLVQLTNHRRRYSTPFVLIIVFLLICDAFTEEKAAQGLVAHKYKAKEFDHLAAELSNPTSRRHRH